MKPRLKKLWGGWVCIGSAFGRPMTAAGRSSKHAFEFYIERGGDQIVSLK